MAFKRVPQKFSASVNTVTLGTGDKSIMIGGENTLPLYTFDAPTEHRPKIGVMITDAGYAKQFPGVAAYYAGAETIGEIAKKAAAMPGADFLVIRLDGASPDGENKSIEECVALLKEIAEAVDIPLAVEGCHNTEKDSQLLVKAAEALQGKNVLLLSAKEEDYKGIAVSASLAYGQKISAESSVDINLAKQLNVLISQMGVPVTDVVMNLGGAAAGYGFEYVASTMDRVRAAALAQNDQMLQMPVINSAADEAWTVKEAIVSEDDFPEWGPVEQRGVSMEIATASACLAAGANAVILMHPDSVAAVSKLVCELM